MENSSVAAIPPKISPLGPISSLPPSPVISPQPTIIAQRFEDAEVSHLITLIGMSPSVQNAIIASTFLFCFMKRT